MRDDQNETPATGANATPEEAAAAETALDESSRGSLVLDELDQRLEAFQAFRKSDSAAADRILTELGANDALDRTIILELGAKRPLGHPEAFPSAHALVVRALEVLDRNGARAVKVRGLGPLGGVAAVFVGLITRFIVRSYQATVIDNLRHLYERREANCLVGDPALPMLTRARIHADRLAPGFKRNPLGVPTFLLGGAALSSVASSLQGVGRAAFGSTIGRVVATAVAFVLFGTIAWLILRGAAVARRRITLTIEEPLRALYQVIGRCGAPPKDQSKQFALYSIILLAVSWIVVPIGLIAAFSL